MPPIAEYNDNPGFQAVVYGSALVTGLPKDAIKDIFDVIDDSLNEYSESTIVLSGARKLSEKNAASIKDHIANHEMIEAVSFSPEYIDIETIHSNNVTIYAIFGGINVCPMFAKDDKEEAADDEFGNHCRL